MGADADKIVSILIKFGMDPAGARGAVAEMKNVEVAATETTAATAAMSGSAADYTAKMAAFDAALSKESQALLGTIQGKEAFVISTEAQYLAAVKLSAQLQTTQLRLALIGRSTTDVSAAIDSVGAALSTESALLQADNYEKKLAAEAAAAHAAALKKEAEATGTNTIAMREASVVARELMRGNFSRIPGSLSILAQSMGGLGMSMGEITTGLIGAYIGFEFLRDLIRSTTEEAKKLNEELAKEQIAVWDDQLKGMSALADEADRYRQTLEKIKTARNDMNQQEQDRNDILQAQWEAQEKILKAQEQAELAAAGSDEVKKAEIRQRYEDVQSRNELDKERQKVQAAKNDMDRAAYANANDQDALTKAQAAAASALDPNSASAQNASKAKRNQDFLNSQNQPLLTDIAGATGTADPAAAAKIIADQLADAQNKVKVAESSGDLNAVIGAEHWLSIIEGRQKELDTVNANNNAIAKDQATIDAHAKAINDATEAEDTAASAAITAAKKAQDTADAYETATKVFQINSGAAQQVQQTRFSSEFQTAITAATSPAGTKLTAEQQAAEQTIITAFQALHGNFILWIQTLVAKVQAGQMTAAQENAIIAATLAQLQGQMQQSPANGNKLPIATPTPPPLSPADEAKKALDDYLNSLNTPDNTFEDNDFPKFRKSWNALPPAGHSDVENADVFKGMGDVGEKIKELRQAIITATPAAWQGPHITAAATDRQLQADLTGNAADDIQRQEQYRADIAKAAGDQKKAQDDYHKAILQAMGSISGELNEKTQQLQSQIHNGGP